MSTNLIDIVFSHCDDAFLHLEKSIDVKYIIDNNDVLISTMATTWKHQSYDNHSSFTCENMIEIFKYVIAEMKQNALNEIRNGISDIVLTVDSILSNRKYYKKLQHSIIKYGYEFELYITVELL
jgi:hypothetical protein